MHHEWQYLRALQDLVDIHDEDPTPKADRTGTGTYNVFGRQWRFPLSNGRIPIITTKKIFTKAIVVELLWFLKGDTNVKYLHDHGVHIWDEWADEYGDLGPVYGKQWRSWGGDYMDGGYDTVQKIDQLVNVIDSLKNNPKSRRHIVTAWNPAEVDQMALPPCHCLFQFFVDGDRLSCQLYQRSADIFLGVPFNITSYALLTHLIAREVGLTPGEFIHTFGDLHLYANHVEQAKQQLLRSPYPSAKLEILAPDHCGIFDLEPADIAFGNYHHHDAIKADVSV